MCATALGFSFYLKNSRVFECWVKARHCAEFGRKHFKAPSKPNIEFLFQRIFTGNLRKYLAGFQNETERINYSINCSVTMSMIVVLVGPDMQRSMSFSKIGP